MARERRLFSEEFKREAVKLEGQPGASKAGIARDLGVGANVLGRWCREANADGQVGGGEKFTRQWEFQQDPERTVTGFLAWFDVIFTLNQDQLLEHHYRPELEVPFGRPAWHGLQLPKATRQAGQVAHVAGSQAGPRWLVRDVGQIQLDPRSQPLYKLHGSSGWADHIHPQVMILGDNKAQDIGLFPVLSHYFESFETALPLATPSS